MSALLYVMCFVMWFPVNIKGHPVNYTVYALREIQKLYEQACCALVAECTTIEAICIL